MGASTTSETAWAIVSRSVDAFNARDIDGMLACLHADVDVHPLRASGVDGRCHGHDGVRRWFSQLARLHDEHHIVLTDIHDLDDGHTLATGTLRLAGAVAAIAPVCVLHRVSGGLITTAHYYYSDPDMLEHIGLNLPSSLSNTTLSATTSGPRNFGTV